MNGFQIKSPESFTSLVDILSGPGAFPFFNLEIAFTTLSIVYQLKLKFFSLKAYFGKRVIIII